jgi:hypothetical protein
MILGAATLACSVAHAGLRALYGGTLNVTSPTAPQVGDAGHAWSSVEVLLASGLGAPLAPVLDGPPESVGSTVHLRLRADATWPDGVPLDAAALAQFLQDALLHAPVSLPPFTMRASHHEVVAELPGHIPDEADYLLLPWLRLSHGDSGGGLRWRDGTGEADASTTAGRSFVDRVHVDVKEARRSETASDGLVLAPGRPVFAFPRRSSEAHDALLGALATLDRTALARYFVRTAVQVPEGWQLPAAREAAVPAHPIVIAVDVSEHDLRTVAERLQILLRARDLTARIAAEDRVKHFARLERGDYDLALVALPPAPRSVQAATLIRLSLGQDAASHFWQEPETASTAASDLKLLRRAARNTGAVMLYLENGGLRAGERVHGPVDGPLWTANVCDLWLGPGGAP